MNCPYCGEVMKEGVIYGDRYRLKWISEEKDQGPILQFLTKGVPVEKDDRTGAITYHCEKDKVFLIKEIED